MEIRNITKKEAYKRGFIIWEGNEENGIINWYARSQNREDEDYGRVYLVSRSRKEYTIL